MYKGTDEVTDDVYYYMNGDSLLICKQFTATQQNVARIMELCNARNSRRVAGEARPRHDARPSYALKELLTIE